MIHSLFAVCSGACAGATLRWLLGLGLNALFPAIPLGTLLANLLGGYLAGIGVAAFAFFPALPLEWRLFVMTGFLGALTTFSTFSIEVMALIQTGRLAYAAGAIALHLGGSLCMTFLGLASFGLVRQ